jgi:hypothetical protein
MSRTSIKCAAETRQQLREIKRDGETWDECLRRLAQLARATQVGGDD